MTSVSRTESKARGLLKYFTGKPCKRGHIAERFVSNHVCIECKLIHAADFNERHPGRLNEIAKKSFKKRYPEMREVIVARCREWRSRNPEKFAQSTRSTRERTREEARRRTAIWQKANPDKVREHSNRRRIRKLGAEGFHTVDDARSIRAKQKDKCAFCRVKLRGKGHLDHIRPLSRGGSDWPRNLQFLCAFCNRSKNARDPIEFAQSLGRLI
jgi:5-methylcytosine-specific restriction endonuclease McrA